MRILEDKYQNIFWSQKEESERYTRMNSRCRDNAPFSSCVDLWVRCSYSEKLWLGWERSVRWWWKIKRYSKVVDNCEWVFFGVVELKVYLCKGNDLGRWCTLLQCQKCLIVLSWGGKVVMIIVMPVWFKTWRGQRFWIWLIGIYKAAVVYKVMSSRRTRQIVCEKELEGYTINPREWIGARRLSYMTKSYVL